MSRLIQGFKDSAHVAADVCSLPIGRVIREFGLQDFLENSLSSSDDAPTICVKAVAYFCEDPDPGLPIVRFAVLSISNFLHRHHANRKTDPPIVAMRDLVALLRAGANESQLRAWVASHFG